MVDGQAWLLDWGVIKNINQKFKGTEIFILVGAEDIVRGELIAKKLGSDRRALLAGHIGSYCPDPLKNSEVLQSSDRLGEL